MKKNKTCFFLLIFFSIVGCGLGPHPIQITKIFGDFEPITINAMPGFVVNADEFEKLLKCEHIEFAFKHEYYFEPNILTWDYIEDRWWNIGM